MMKDIILFLVYKAKRQFSKKIEAAKEGCFSLINRLSKTKLVVFVRRISLEIVKFGELYLCFVSLENLFSHISV